MIRVHSREYPGKISLQKFSGRRVSKEIGSLLLQHQMCESMQRRHAAQDIGRILEATHIHIGVSVVRYNCTTESHPGLHADLRKAGIIPVHQIVSKHQPEVTGMVERKRDKCDAQRAHVTSNVV